MEQTNPYSAPAASLADAPAVPGTLVDASRWARLGAALIDGIIAFAVLGPLMYVTGGFVRNLPFATLLAYHALGFVLYVALHGVFLKRNGQTIGKKLVGIRIVGLDDRNPGLAAIILRRQLPIAAMTVIPYAGRLVGVVDALFIFRANRRCLHDLIGGTRVVNA